MQAIFPFGRAAVVVVALCLAALSGQAQQVIFSNLGAGDSYDASLAYNVKGPAAFGERQYVANTFIPTGSDYQLSKIELPLALVGGVDQVDVRLMTDDGGLPGTTLESFTLTGLPADPGQMLTATSTLHPVLHQGTDYWCAITPAGDTQAHWFLNNTGSTGPCAENTLGLWALMDTPQTQGAFMVEGAPVRGILDTPEPGPLAVATGAILAGAAYRRRRR